MCLNLSEMFELLNFYILKLKIVIKKKKKKTLIERLESFIECSCEALSQEEKKDDKKFIENEMEINIKKYKTIKII